MNNKILSVPVCIVCGNKFDVDSDVLENGNGFCYCSVECVLNATGFKRIKWSDKYQHCDKKTIHIWAEEKFR